MSLAYQITKRGAEGQPLEIACQVHVGCTWKLATSGPRRDDDAILKAMMAAHVSERSTPDRPAAGHQRRRKQ